MLMKKQNYSRLETSDLLKIKLKNLSIGIKGSIIEGRISKLFSELEEKGLSFKPHIWISDEWFTPDDTAGFAVPFYLFHPRLIKLEKEEMYEAEGEKKTECMQILRHETGHAISHAYKLYRLQSWRKIFGNYKKPYPLSYSPRIRSRDFVTHLNAWYAQAHPLEDFAETFAVWLSPKINWRKFYRGWNALHKLNYMDEIMKDIGSRDQIIPPGEEYANLKDLNYTLAEHYRRKKKFYSVDWAHSFDPELQKIFTQDKKKGKSTAWIFLKRERSGIRRNISEVLDVPQYTVDQLLSDLIKRSIRLNLFLKTNEDEAQKRILIIITAQLMNFSHSGYHRIPL
jgi:hypothetical protein